MSAGPLTPPEGAPVLADITHLQAGVLVVSVAIIALCTLISFLMGVVRR